MVPSSAVTLNVTVLSPSTRSTWWPSATLSASAGLYSTLALPSDVVISTDTWSTEFSTLWV